LTVAIRTSAGTGDRPVSRPPPDVLYFLRHGQTDWNAEGRLQGQADTDLNALGRSQATANGHRLAELIGDPAGFDFVASPLSRTRQTMELARSAMGLDPADYRLEPRIVEVHFGDWQGFTFAELERSDPGCGARRNADKWHFLPPGDGAESYQTLSERIGPWLRSIDRPTVCVTHGGVIRTIFRLAGGMDQETSAALSIPQDRVLGFEKGRLAWL
jgi:broad specificity phosphatase PhoE